ncbi:MAG TPA: hypothetical protein VGB55_11855 [Tepidisphaeraceae bacterium]
MPSGADPRSQPLTALSYATPRSSTRVFPLRAAKYAFYSGIVVWLIIFLTIFLVRVLRDFDRYLPIWCSALIGLTCVFLILSGFVLGVLALIGNRQSHTPGLTGYAITGVAINSLFIGVPLAGAMYLGL